MNVYVSVGVLMLSNMNVLSAKVKAKVMGKVVSICK
jgi:hypothetical protein